MRKVICFILTFVLCVSAAFVSVAAVDGITTNAFKVVIADNGNGTVTVYAYAPVGVNSGKIVVGCTDDLVYLEGESPDPCILNEEYNRNGVKGVCIVFAYAVALKTETLIFTGTYQVAEDTQIDESDVFSYEWNLSNEETYVGNQNTGELDVSYAPKQYTVKFCGFNGELLKEESVVNGGSATAPDVATIEGYDFVGWDTDFSVITSDIIVTAKYQIKYFTVTFVAGEGGIISGTAEQSVAYGTVIADLSYPDAVANEGYKFDRWECATDKVNGDTTVKALFVPAVVYTLGDVNNDGYVDNTDAAIILKYDAGIIDSNDLLFNTGDVNNDGYVDNTDASIILKYDAGVIPSI